MFISFLIGLDLVGLDPNRDRAIIYREYAERYRLTARLVRVLSPSLSEESYIDPSINNINRYS